jgi:hypothetical protein
MTTRRAWRQPMLRARTSPLWIRLSPGPRGGAHRTDAALVAGINAGTVSATAAKAVRVVVRKRRRAPHIARHFHSVGLRPRSVWAEAGWRLYRAAWDSVPGFSNSRSTGGGRQLGDECPHECRPSALALVERDTALELVHDQLGIERGEQHIGQVVGALDSRLLDQRTHVGKVGRIHG